MKGFLVRLLMYPLCLFLLTVCIYTLIVSPFNFNIKGGSIWLVLVTIIVLIYLVVDIILLFRKNHK